MSIRINNLKFSYTEQTHPVLDIADWHIDSGEQVFVQGDSGSGKSTLLNILCGTLKSDQGELRLFDQRVDQFSASQRDRFRANNIGYVFQQFNLIGYLNLIDNVHLASHFCRSNQRRPSKKHITDLLNQLNIDEKYWDKPAKQLSIGQQQRVAIARALINQPRLLVVDEPTSSLDSRNRDDFMSLLMSSVEGSGTTLIFVSHDISLASYFPRVDKMQDISSSSGLVHHALKDSRQQGSH